MESTKKLSLDFLMWKGRDQKCFLEFLRECQAYYPERKGRLLDLLSKPKSATAKNLFETQIFSSLNRVIMASKPLLRIFEKHALNLRDSREWRVALKLDLVINQLI